MDGIQNILKAISKNIGRDLTKDTDSVKIIGKLIGYDLDQNMDSIEIIGKFINRDISQNMDLIKIIGKISDNHIVKTIANSVNENQNLSKEWLVDNIKTKMDMYDNPKICVAAGWYGMLADRMSTFTDKRVVSFDINPECITIGKMMYPNVQFKTADIKTFNAKPYDVIICTSCEHFSDDVLNQFLDSRDKGNCLVVLQSNNYFGIDEHVNCKESLKDFQKSVRIRALNTLEKRINDKFDRYMLIGY